MVYKNYYIETNGEFYRVFKHVTRRTWWGRRVEQMEYISQDIGISLDSDWRPVVFKSIEEAKDAIDKLNSNREEWRLCNPS